MNFEKTKMRIAFALPAGVAYWAAIRVAAHASGSKYPTQVVPELTAMDALKRFGDDNDLHTPTRMERLRWKLNALAYDVKRALSGRALRLGLAPGAIALEADEAAVQALPEFQRGWYAKDPASGKFKLDPSKVEIEDVSALRSTVQSTRDELKRAKDAAAEEVRKALEPFKGIDPQRTRAMMDALASEEERALIAKGPDGMKQVIDSRMQKAREEMENHIKAADEKYQGSVEVIGHLQGLVLDNFVRQAATEAGIHPGAIDDVLLRARQLFSLNETLDGVVQYEGDGDNESIVMGKDGKTPFGPKEWLEKMKEKAPHWYPASGAGGGAGGNRGGKGAGKDLTGLTPQQRMTLARGG